MLRLLADGMSVAAIAKQLFVSESTEDAISTLGPQF